jgi:hypothetical protein
LNAGVRLEIVETSPRKMHRGPLVTRDKIMVGGVIDLAGYRNVLSIELASVINASS